MTSSVTVYHIPASEIVNGLAKDKSCCINLIDTPGFGDTRGPKWDSKIFEMIARLLNSLDTLDYIMMAVKSTDNRLGASAKFVYTKIQQLYAKDISERVIGMFTFSDGSPPPAIEAVKAAKIKINEKYFIFNNSAMWAKEEGMEGARRSFDLGMTSFSKLASFMKDKDAMPISLHTTKEVLKKRKLMELHSRQAKSQNQFLTGRMYEIGTKIV